MIASAIYKSARVHSAKWESILPIPASKRRVCNYGLASTGTRHYGLGRVMASLSDTGNTTIRLTILVMNLKKSLWDLFDAIYHLLDCCFSTGLIFKLPVEQ